MLAILGMLTLAAPAGGQALVTGRVVEQGSTRPVPGALITLLREGQRLATSLSDDGGQYSITAPQAGRYRLRVDYIGYERWVSAAFALSGSASTTLHVELPLRRVTLETVVVRAAAGCALDQEGVTDAGRIWEEIRRALTISDLTAQEARFAYEWRVTERQRSSLGTVTAQQEWTLEGDAVLPWTLRPMDLLDRRGWVRGEGDSVVFYGPGAETLLSQKFIQTHCFTPVRRAGQVGLAFTPVKARKLTDIAGTIWLDERSSELRRVEFEYRNLPKFLESRPPAGGELTFARLPNGQWYVHRWLIRMPLPDRFFLERTGEARVQ